MFQRKWTLFLIVDTVGHKFFSSSSVHVTVTFFSGVVWYGAKSKIKISSEFQIIMFSINAVVIHALTLLLGLTHLHRLTHTHFLYSNSLSLSLCLSLSITTAIAISITSSNMLCYPFSSRLMTSGTWIVWFCLDWYSLFSQLNSVFVEVVHKIPVAFIHSNILARSFFLYV